MTIIQKKKKEKKEKIEWENVINSSQRSVRFQHFTC